MKEWYCLFSRKKEGPFSVEELKRHPRFTPDVLVWKQGFLDWVPAGQVPALAKIFKDEKKKKKNKKEAKGAAPRGEVLAAGQNHPSFFWLLLVAILVIILSFFRLYLK